MVQLGCAVVDLGYVGQVFAWAHLDDRTLTWERKVPFGRGLDVGPTPASGGRFDAGEEVVAIDERGGFVLDAKLAEGRLRARIEAGEITPVTLLTPTAGGGWNCTEKGAGYRAHGEIDFDGAIFELDGGGWRDWTTGRQDRHTAWRWAAGAGRTSRRQWLGINVSSGMNARKDGENVVWWDGQPYALVTDRLEPEHGDPARSWRLGGPGWSLRLEPHGVRKADESLLVVRSRYVQPIGVFRGTLPDPEGGSVEIEYLIGVTEDHEAVW